MNINGTRFGDIEYCEEDIVFFPEGLIGFSRLQHYLVLSTKVDSHFRWLQSLEEPALAFLVTDPNCYVEGYEPCIDESLAGDMDLDEETPRLLYTTVSIPTGCPEEMTINLAAPIVINALTRVARQFVLEDQAYTIKHRVFQSADRAAEKQVA